QQPGRQVVDDVPVEVLQRRSGAGASGAGHPGDDEEFGRIVRRQWRGLVEDGDPLGNGRWPVVAGRGCTLLHGAQDARSSWGAAPSDSRTARAVRGPIPFTAATSSTRARRMFFTEPKALSRAAWRVGPSPGTSSSTD